MEKIFEERVAEAKANVSAVSPNEANERKVNNPDIVFIDPRDVEDIQSTTGIIPVALNVPLSTLSTLSDDSKGSLPEEIHSHAHQIITACQGGPMVALAAHALKQRGYNNVSFIDGGTQGWLDTGFATA